MQYSLDSTNGTDGTWTNASATNTLVTFVAGDVYVRQTAVPSNFRLVATIAAAAAAPTSIGINVETGEITGTTATQQYSLDGGTTWNAATAVNTDVTFASGNSVVVREKATAGELASALTTPINVAAPATAPNGIGINVETGEITGTTATQQYSLDGGTTWNAATAGSTAVTFAAGNSVVVREKATASALASNATTPILVQAAAAAPTNIGIDVTAGQITGTTATQQYSVDGGTTWNDATATNTAVAFAGGNSIVVREKATASALASNATTPILVQAPASAPTNIGINVVAGQITGTTATQEYSLNGGTDWTNATATNTDVIFSAGDSVVVREKATATAFASLQQTVGTIAAQEAAPTANKAQGTNGGTMKLTGLTNGVTYEYVVDSNATLAGSAAEWSGATSVTLSSTDINNIAVDDGQYVHIRVKATATNLASNVQDVAQVVVGDIKPVAEADAEDVASEKAALTLPPSAYTGYAIPQPTAAFGTTISWQVINREEIMSGGSITATGSVGVGVLKVYGDRTDRITFEATITKGATTDTKQFVVTIH